MDITRTQAAVMVAALSTARAYAAHDEAVLIMGETGTGKTEMAAYIHAQSQRAAKPFVEVDCAALPRDLIESELFGHTKGAFSGAVTEKRGLFEEANGGTIFLDEIGELGLESQQKLLCALQSGRVRRVGSLKVITIDVRVIAATNRDLKAEVKAGRFREDLYYRLALLDLIMPPLRDRREDIPLILEGEPRRPSQEASDALAAAPYGWPGNIRELLNNARKAAVLGWGAAEVEEAFAPLPVPAVDVAREEVVLGLAREGKALRGADVIAATGLSRSGAARLLRRLVERGDLRKSTRGEYSMWRKCSAIVAPQERHNGQPANTDLDSEEGVQP